MHDGLIGKGVFLKIKYFLTFEEKNRCLNFRTIYARRDDWQKYFLRKKIFKDVFKFSHNICTRGWLALESGNSDSETTTMELLATPYKLKSAL